MSEPRDYVTGQDPLRDGLGFEREQPPRRYGTRACRCSTPTPDPLDAGGLLCGACRGWIKEGETE